MFKDKRIYFAPSLLSADFTNVQNAVRIMEKASAEFIHLDVMDGLFVPNITFGHKMVKDISGITNLALDVHLMVENPEKHIANFASSGAEYITFHLEAAIHSHRIIEQIKGLGCKAGISIVPGTPVSSLSELLPIVDLVLVMSVNPGFGGQSFIPGALEKIKFLDSIRRKNGYNYLISIDGGVNRNNSGKIRNNGADILVSGSSFFNSSDPYAEANFIRGNKEV
ncbi:MAG: ribulose-phosphate 3-epimerase [Spirochaetales bacterium]|nr:ribulose-phosphate 3-epimerase [Spirochaetales bacterium]